MNNGRIEIRTEKLGELTRREPFTRGRLSKKSKLSYMGRILYNLREVKELEVLEVGHYTIFKYSF